MLLVVDLVRTLRRNRAREQDPDAVAAEDAALQAARAAAAQARDAAMDDIMGVPASFSQAPDTPALSAAPSLAAAADVQLPPAQ